MRYLDDASWTTHFVYMKSIDHSLALLLSEYEYQLLENDQALCSAAEGAAYFGISIEQTAPTVIVETEGVLYACIVSGGRKKIDFQKLAEILGHQSVMLAKRQRVQEVTGYDAGFIPMLGLAMPYVMDKNLLGFGYIYGGVGHPNLTLKISATNLISINDISIFYEE